MSQASIILLSGISSAGKSSIARELQEIARKPILHVQMDSFLSMMPPRYANHPDAFKLIERRNGESPEVEIVTGLYGSNLLKGMRRSIAALAEQGLDLIIDDVLIENQIEDYQSTLAPFQFRTAGVMCALEEAERRERARGDRMLGLARWQFTRVHSGLTYDLVLNTDVQSSAACAENISAAFGL